MFHVLVLSWYHRALHSTSEKLQEVAYTHSRKIRKIEMKISQVSKTFLRNTRGRLPEWCAKRVARLSCCFVVGTDYQHWCYTQFYLGGPCSHSAKTVIKVNYPLTSLILSFIWKVVSTISNSWLIGFLIRPLQ